MYNYMKLRRAVNHNNGSDEVILVLAITFMLYVASCLHEAGFIM